MNIDVNTWNSYFKEEFMNHMYFNLNSINFRNGSNIYFEPVVLGLEHRIVFAEAESKVSHMPDWF